MVRLVLFYVALCMSGFIGKAIADPAKLAQIASDLETSFPEISHLSTIDFAAMAERDDDIVLVDVRRETEFAVSRIEGAVRISPSASVAEVADILGPSAAERHVVFYCSVGVRSSKLAERSRDALRALGALQISNLSGGIFAWHNEGRPLVNESGPTDRVHPYDRNWGKLLARQSAVAMRPDLRHAE